MLIKPPSDVRSSEITPLTRYLNRREFIKGVGYAAAAAGAVIAAGRVAGAAVASAPHGAKLANVKPSAFSTTEQKNSWDQITTYNNFYEFGVDKDDPAQYAHLMKTEPWTVKVEGECANKASYHVEDIIKPSQLEDRVYRHRCVEAWSMVIPWVGIPLADFIKRCEPTSKAKYVEFTTLLDTRQMPGARTDVLVWPYVEGLRMDEAMNPLTLLAVGLYGEVLPNQDGAPIRLVIPWKYGFKSIKSIVRIKFVESQPLNTWKRTTPSEYGFYANVNPTVDHPRWSQATERRIGEFFKRKTVMFNGYADQVAGMYAGMDLKKNF